MFTRPKPKAELADICKPSHKRKLTSGDTYSKANINKIIPRKWTDTEHKRTIGPKYKYTIIVVRRKTVTEDVHVL